MKHTLTNKECIQFSHALSEFRKKLNTIGVTSWKHFKADGMYFVNLYFSDNQAIYGNGGKTPKDALLNAYEEAKEVA